MKGYICITLRSDMCAASGDGFSLSIDTDVCADKYGFPYIPSRRLKGCLREAAEYIGCECTEEIFGSSGDIFPGSLRITNARLENYASLKAEAEEQERPAGQILALFTSIKASTAIENDTAKENSLRFTRVVNHYSPFDGNELKFISDVYYSDEYEAQLIRICKALRNIGYKRTRGYGSVKCEFSRAEKTDGFHINIPADNKEYELCYTVQLESPAMFAGKNSTETADYIPGSAVLGAYASEYLKTAPADQKFEDLFLNDRLRFSNLYITVGNTVSEPAPAILGKMKCSSEIVPVFGEDNKDNRPVVKPFKSAYLIGKKEIKVEKETIYHHGKKQGEEADLLYTQECLCEGQLFSGYIAGQGIDLANLLPAFEKMILNLGRSKSAQYSACKIIAAECKLAEKKQVNGEKLFALLCSDVILVDEYADCTTEISDLYKELDRVLGSICADEDDRKNSSLRYRTVMGYISAGRYKRSHIRAFEKGSTLCFSSDHSLPRYITVGERRNEGFGVIKICTEKELMALGKTSSEIKEQKNDTKKLLSDLLYKNDCSEKRLEDARRFAVDFYNSNIVNDQDITASFIGRLLLMTKQASDAEELEKLFKSIKSENKRNKALELKNSAQKICGNEWKGKWREFVKAALTVIKYRMKGDHRE